MDIDCSKLERVKTQCRKSHKDEIYFKVPIPELPNYAISNYGHFVRFEGGTWKTCELRYRQTDKRSGDYFRIWKEDYRYAVTLPGKKEYWIGLTEVIRRTFYPNAERVHKQKGEYLLNAKTISRGSFLASNRPVIDVRRFDVTNSFKERFERFIGLSNGTYQHEIHELINIPDLPPLPERAKQPKPPKPQVLDDGTPVKNIPGLTISYINNHYDWMRARALNVNYKNRKDKIRYKDTTMSEDWLQRVNFQRWANDNFYEYPELLELDKDIFGLCEANKYSAETCCFVPKYLNQMFVNKPKDKGEKAYLGYSITQVVRKKGNVRYCSPTVRNQSTGFYATGSTFDNYSEALKHARTNKANNIRAAAQYERERGFIPEKILRQLERIAALMETGKIKLFEPSEETVKNLIRDGKTA